MLGAILGRGDREPSGRILASSEQKAFRWKEDIRVRDGEAGGGELLTIKADRVLDSSAADRVTDARTGEPIGSLRRKGWSSMLRDSWEVLDPQGVVRGRVTEDSGGKALARRMHEGLALVLPQTFHLDVAGQVVGTMARNFNPFAHKFAVDLSGDSDGLLPRPLAVATVILLLAIEGRQSGG